MAITILGSPTTPNVTDTKLVYSISSSNALQPQFQYVTDVYDGSTLLTRLYTYPNPTGNGIIEVSQILADNVEYDNDWKVTNSTAAGDTYKSIKLAFSESYGTSISSSTALYAGGASNNISVFPGTVDPNSGTFNFPSSSFADNVPLTNYSYYSGSTFASSKIDEMKSIAYSGDYETISLLPMNGTLSSVTYKTYNSAGSQLDSTGISGFGSELYNIPVGPQNMVDKGGLYAAQFTGSWDYYEVEITDGGGTHSMWYKKHQACEQGVRFAFINRYGVYDYYSIYNPVRRVTNVSRKTFEKPNVNYSSTISTYDITRRGEKQYNTGYTDRYEVTTDYLNKPTADWLTELLDSPEVFVQENGDFIPIVITNSGYTWNMNQARQKLFQFTVEYRYANKRYDR